MRLFPWFKPRKPYEPYNCLTIRVAMDAPSSEELTKEPRYAKVVRRVHQASIRDELFKQEKLDAAKQHCARCNDRLHAAVQEIEDVLGLLSQSVPIIEWLRTVLEPAVARLYDDLSQYEYRWQEHPFRLSYSLPAFHVDETCTDFWRIDGAEDATLSLKIIPIIIAQHDQPHCSDPHPRLHTMHLFAHSYRITPSGYFVKGTIEASVFHDPIEDLMQELIRRLGIVNFQDEVMPLLVNKPQTIYAAAS